MKKLIISLSVALLLLTSATPTLATTLYQTSIGHTFSESWSASCSGFDEVPGVWWNMIYGYNTDWINEDFTHTNHTTKTHLAKVQNNNGMFSDEASANNWAEIEVVHSGTTITYYITY